MKGEKRQYVQDVINFMVLRGYLEITDGEFPVLILGKNSGEILSMRKPIFMKKEKEISEEVDLYKKYMNINNKKLPPDKAELFESLKRVRAAIAAREAVPSYIVFSNATLEDMCIKMPRTRSEFLEVSGVGRRKLESYGDEFLKVLNEFDN